jgi:translation initiation factor 1
MTPPRKPRDGLVYSTEQGRMCPDCGKPVGACACRRDTAAPRDDGIVRVCRETKGRRGKSVTLIKGVPLTQTDLKKIAKELKSRCGSGGTVKEGVIEIQGDHRETILAELKMKGWTVKISGG